MHIKQNQDCYKTTKKADLLEIVKFHKDRDLQYGLIPFMPDDNLGYIYQTMKDYLSFCYLVVSVKKS